MTMPSKKEFEQEWNELMTAIDEPTPEPSAPLEMGYEIGQRVEVQMKGSPWGVVENKLTLEDGNLILHHIVLDDKTRVNCWVAFEDLERLPDKPQFKVGDRVKHPNMVKPFFLTQVDMPDSRVMAVVEGGDGLPWTLSADELELVEGELIITTTGDPQMDDIAFFLVNGTATIPAAVQDMEITMSFTIGDPQDHVKPTTDNPFPTLREFLS